MLAVKPNRRTVKSCARMEGDSTFSALSSLYIYIYVLFVECIRCCTVDVKSKLEDH